MQALCAPLTLTSRGKAQVWPSNLAAGRIRPSVDFVDGSGNKKPGTVRSQIVPCPALTASATQVFARLGILIDLLLFSVHYRTILFNIFRLYASLKESIRLHILQYHLILLRNSSFLVH